MLDLLYQRRSIRKYLAQPVEQEKVQQLVKAPCWRHPPKILIPKVYRH